MARLDPHSHADDTQAQTESLDWDARVDFGAQRIEARAVLHLKAPIAGPFDLDTRGLEIRSVADERGEPLPFDLGPYDAILGARLRVQLRADTRAVAIDYRTSPGASALQWLQPAQTLGKKHPYLFSQCQAVHARSVVPLQDTPRLRITYAARITVPRELRAVMAARSVGRSGEGALAQDAFEMPQPIPPYLFAFAVGDLSSRDLSPRSRIWAEPGLLDAAAHEFAGVERMLATAEKLFGPYDWERFDLLVMPPSFPYGGMENPRLTFLTPTLLAGDRSMVNVVVHELAHSWTGNLVTSSSAEHFWLNEGFTVWAERRILEALEGRDVSELHAALGRRALAIELQNLADRPELTRLRLHLAGVHADDAFSTVPYEKGYLLLRALEEHVGRERWDAFVASYLAAFRFGSLTTERFAAFCEEKLPGALTAVGATRYLDEPGVPASAPEARSERLQRIQSLRGHVVDAARTAGWTATEWQLYLEGFDPGTTPLATVQELDARFHLTEQGNAEILVTWLRTAVRAGHDPAVRRAIAFVKEVGRMKYLRPIYAALASRPELRDATRRTYEEAAPGYHPIARHAVERELARAKG